MKVLSEVEIANVSGAGVVSDAIVAGIKNVQAAVSSFVATKSDFQTSLAQKVKAFNTSVSNWLTAHNF